MGRGIGPALEAIDVMAVLERALAKFIAICEAQGGLRIPPKAAHTHSVTAPANGAVSAIDSRLVARVAKLAGAPRDPAAGATMHVQFEGPRGTWPTPLHASCRESGRAAIRLELPAISGQSSVSSSFRDSQCCAAST